MQAKVVHRSLGQDSEPSEGGRSASDLRLRLAGHLLGEAKSARFTIDAVGDSCHVLVASSYLIRF